MIRSVALLAVLFLAGCVSQSDVRAQIDQSAAALRQEFTAAQNEATARNEKLAAEIGRASKTLRDFLQRQRTALADQVAILDQIISSLDNASQPAPPTAPARP